MIKRNCLKMSPRLTKSLVSGLLRDRLQGGGEKLKQLLETGQLKRQAKLTLLPIQPRSGGVVSTADRDPSIILEMTGQASYDASNAVSAWSDHTPHNWIAYSGTKGLATKATPASMLTMPVLKNSLGQEQIGQPLTAKLVLVCAQNMAEAPLQ